MNSLRSGNLLSVGLLLQTLRILASFRRFTHPLILLFGLLVSLTMGMAAHAAPVWQTGTGNQTTSSGSASTFPATQSVNKPTNVQTGDLVLVTLFYNRTSLTISNTQGFTEIRNETSGANGNTRATVAAFYKIATAAEPASYTFTYAGSGGTTTSWRAVAQRVTGHNASTPIGNQNGSNSASTTTQKTRTVTSINTTLNDSLMVAAIAMQASSSTITTTPSGTTSGVSSTSTGPSYNVAYQTIATAGATGDKTWGWTNARANAALLFIINPAPPAFPPAEYGDAPASYGNPSHTITTNLAIGNNVDVDNGTQQNANADADDTNGSPDDEDGLQNPAIIPTTVGQTYTLTTYVKNEAGSTAYLTAYIDFNRDGDFLDAGEQADTQHIYWNGYFNSTFTVPAGTTAGTTYARLRLSQTKTEAESPLDAATSGEVEDHKLTISAGPFYDFGDAPATYGNARHTIVNSLFLGENRPDSEATSQPSYNASGDGADEDGAPKQYGNSAITLFPILKMTATSYTVDVRTTNTTGSAGKLYGWIDFDQNGAFDADEAASANVANNTNGTVTLTWNSIPTDIKLGTTFIRLRLTTDAAVTSSTPANNASNGEVEDFPIAVAIDVPPDSPNVTIVRGEDQSCSSTIFSDNFDDLASDQYFGANTSATPFLIRNWTATGGGSDTYARTVEVSPFAATQGRSIYFGNGMIRRYYPQTGGVLAFDGNGRMLEPPDAIELRDNADDVTPGVNAHESDWGPEPVTLSRTFASTAGQRYRLYFSAIPEGGEWQSGMMRVDTPSGSVHFKAPGQNEGIQKYRIEFTATGASSTIRFVNYGHIGTDGGYCDPNSVFTGAWCSVGGFPNDKKSNELIVDDVSVALASACATSGISGFVYADNNGNNAFETATESGIAGIGVTLYDNNGTTATTNDDSQIATTSTSANGAYSFASISPSPRYRIEVEARDADLPASAVIGTPNPIADAAVTAGSTLANQNFGFDLACNASAGQFGGIAFRDYNQNGIREPQEEGVAAITVTAYNSGNAVAATATTDARGWYTLSGLTNGTQYRLEYTNLPAGLHPGAVGTDSVSTVRFITASGSCAANLGLSDPSEYCEIDPSVAAFNFVNGAPSVTDVGNYASLFTFPYNATGDAYNQTPAPISKANTSQTGALWGMAYQKTTRTLFASAAMRRFSGFGTLGTGGIYKVDMTDPNAAYTGATPYVDLRTIGIDTGNDVRVAGDSCNNLASGPWSPSRDVAAWDKVGKVGVGDIDYDERNNRLWLVNLNDRKLYGINNVSPTTTPTAGSVSGGYAINLPSPHTCASGTFRPWAVKYHRGYVYVGGVCDAASDPYNLSKVRGYVLRFDPANTAAGFSHVKDFAINQPRQGFGYSNVSEWSGWLPQADAVNVRPQFHSPIVGDLEFDTDGSIIVGIIDRAGLQKGTNAYDEPVCADPTIDYADTMGDVLRLCKTDTGYLSDSEPGCTTAIAANSKTTDEYYWGDLGPSNNAWEGMNDIAAGGLALAPGKEHVLASAYDANSWGTNGVIWLNNRTGAKDNAYSLSWTTLGKSTGMGELEVLCDPAPTEVGNRVWLDTDKDGLQDAGEAGINNVNVTLTCGSDSATTTTNTNGEYYFSNAPGKNAIFMGSGESCSLSVANAQASLSGYTVTTQNADGKTDNNSQTDIRDSDAAVSGSNAVITFTVGSSGQNNHGLDFGYKSTSSPGTVSGTVYLDANKNAAFDAGETGLANITVSLYDENATAGNLIDDTLVNTTTTNASGAYSFANVDALRTYRVTADTTDPDLPANTSSTTTNPLTAVTVTAGGTTANKNFGFGQVVAACSPPSPTTTGINASITWNHNPFTPASQTTGGHPVPAILNTGLIASAANEVRSNLTTGATDWEMYAETASVPATLTEAISSNKYFGYSFTTQSSLSNSHILYGVALSTLGPNNIWNHSGKYKVHIRIDDNAAFASPVIAKNLIQIDEDNPTTGGDVSEGPLYGSDFYISHYDFDTPVNLEANKTYYLRFYVYDDAKAGVANSVPGRIIFDDLLFKTLDCGAAPPTLLSISDAVVTEGNSGLSYLNFPVQLSAAAPAGGVSFNYATADGTATLANNDYQSKTGTLTIPMGANGSVISVPVVGDTNIETNEHISLNVTNVSSNAQYVNAQYPQSPQGTIIDDDAAVACQAGSGHFGGMVFQDFNQNGTRENGEIGLAGVTVTAYNSSNAVTATATTDAGGWYKLTGLTNGTQYRLEFTGLPSGTEQGAAGSVSATNVQFVTVSATCNANLGVYNPVDYCQADPKLLTARYVNGDTSVSSAGMAGTFGALLSYQYNASGIAATLNQDALASQVGSVWGLAYNRHTKKAFASAMIRRHVGLGPLGIGGLYVINYSGASPVVSSFLNLDGLAGIDVGSIGSNSARNLPGDPYLPNHDPTTFDKTGKEGLGDVELSDDGNTLYVTNLYSRKIIKVDLTTYNTSGTVPTTATEINLPTVSCTNGVARPFALKYYRGKLHAGITCTGENGGSSADLKASIQAYDGTSWGEKLQVPLNYQTWHADHVRASEYSRSNIPWVSSISQLTLGNHGNIDWADDSQLLLSGIEFDGNGDMLLGFIDRTGLQFGQYNYGTDTSSTRFYGVFSNGELLKAGYNASTGVYTLENAGSVNGIAGEGAKTGTEPAWPYGGPSGGEFYGGERFAGHTENSFGALALVPGKQEVALNAMNPFNITTGGTIWLNNQTGTRTSGVQLYGEDNRFLGKAVGLGDLEVMCDPAPTEIGNRVWLDSDSDGLQGAGEAGINNVTVTLTCGTDTATATTNAQGEYYFSNKAGGNATFMGNGESCSLSINNTQASLSTHTLTTQNAGGRSDNDRFADIRDSDAAVNGGNAVINFTVGSSGQNNHGLDFGYKPSNSTTTPPAPSCPAGALLWQQPGDINSTDLSVNGPVYFTAVTQRSILDSAGLPAAFAAPVGVSVTISQAITWDYFPTRVADGAQPNEKIRLVFLKNGVAVGMSDWSGDLADDVAGASWTGGLGTLTLPNGADEVRIVHWANTTYGTNDSSNYNSLRTSSLCIEYTPITTGAITGSVYLDTNGDDQYNAGSLGVLRADLLALYDFQTGSGTSVADVSGVGSAMNLTIPDPAKVQWLSGGGLKLTATTRLSATADTKLRTALQATNEVTLEAWIKPSNLTQTGPGRIMTLSADTANRNITLGQDASAYNARLRTTGTDSNGLPATASSAGKATTALQHVVYTRSASGLAQIYVNGVVVAISTVAGDFSNWNSAYNFALGDEFGSTSRAWLGEYHKVAIYKRALTADEVSSQYSFGKGAVTLGETVIPNIKVSLLNHATGVEIATTDTAADGSYHFNTLESALTYRLAVDTTDTDLPAGSAIGTINPLTNKTVTAGGTLANQNFGFDAAAISNIAGKIFEDVNYGGGAGRALATAGAAGITGARVERYDASGNFVSSTTTDASGAYSFTDVPNGNYFVRIVNDTVKSTRAGSNGTERGIQTYRTDGTTATTSEVGGRKPAVVDAAANTTNQTLNTTTFVLSGGGQAQSVQAIALSSGNVTAADFGFNFSTIVNANDSGQGSFRQFILNSNLLGGEATLAQTGRTAGKENAIFELPTSDPKFNAANQYWSIAVATAMPEIGDNVIIDASTQPARAGFAFANRPVIELDGTIVKNLNQWHNGLILAGANGGSTVKYLAINRFQGAGIKIRSSKNNTVSFNAIGTDPLRSSTTIGNNIGIEIVSAADFSFISDNVIAHNNWHGIHAWNFNGGGTAKAATISRNSTYANGGLGISLEAGDTNGGITVNDANDADTGANSLLNFPILSQISSASGNLTLTGCAPSGATVELFEADVSPGGAAAAGANKFGKSKDYGEGQTYLTSFVEGSAADSNTANCALATDADGNNQTGMKAFSVTIPAPAGFVSGDLMTATATLASVGTSEFSPTVAYVSSITCALVVTTTADTDTAGNTSGSLRDAIDCANSTAGTDTITFNMPTTETGFTNPTGAGNDYWKISLNSQLPSITEALTIDGRTQTTNKGNTNSGNVAASTTVGVDGLVLAAVAAPEVEIVGQWYGAGLDIKASNVNIYGLGMRLFDTDIRMDQANTTGILMDGMAFGVNPVDGSDPGGGQRSNQHLAVNASNVSFVLTNSVLGYNDTKRGIVTGEYNTVSSVSATISGNHFVGVGLSGNANNGAIEILRTQSPSVTITGNRFVGRGAASASDLAIEFNDYGGGNTTCVTCLVENNTINDFHDGVGYFTDASLTGLHIRKNRISASTEFAVFLGNVQNATVSQNQLFNNGKSGVLINKDPAKGNVITQNGIYNNGEVGINLADGNQVEPGGMTLNDANDTDAGANNLLNFPILSQITPISGNLTLTGCAPSGATVELFEADVSPGGAATVGANKFGLSKDYGEGQTYLASFVEGSAADTDAANCNLANDTDGNYQTGMKAFTVTIPTPAGFVTGDLMTATATLASVGTSEFSPVFTYPASISISGNVFEDVNYGGGAGRAFGTAGTVGVTGARVEVYGTSGNFMDSTTTDTSGLYSFTGVPDGDYYVRVVNNTVKSTRTGSNGTERAIQTYRTDGTTAVINEVGGRKPASVDAAANTTNQTLNTSTFLLSGGGQVQSIQPITILSGVVKSASSTEKTAIFKGPIFNTVKEPSFGFNFSTVVNTNDSGQGSLRQAITNANLLANTGMAQPNNTYGINTALSKEVLVFNIPATGDPLGRADICGGATCNITVNTQLPSVTAPLIIDGTTQPGYTAGTPGVPRIHLSPLTGLDAFGLSIEYTATDSTVRGLSITGFRTHLMNRAISVAAARVVLESNYIGVKPDGTANANGHGILLEYADTATTVIGGTTTAKRNIISGNLRWGIAGDTGATGGTIQHNFIGTNVTGTAALGNQAGGIDLESANDSKVLDNVIAGNAGDGIQIGFTSGPILTSGYTIQGNRIGVGINGESIGNTGPGIMNYGGSSNHLIGGTAAGQGNIIANNTASGIRLAANNTSVTNIISGNSLYNNGGLGIDLNHDGVTVNDANDTDNGANNLLNFPVLSQIISAGSNLTVTGCAPAGATVELFEADVSPGGKATLGDNKVGKSKDYGEGQTYLASFVEGSAADTNATNCALATDADGNNQTGMKAFSVTIPAPAGFVTGDIMTATATISTSGTSEFSPAILLLDVRDIAGKVYEDVNYGGGTGRAFNASQSMAGISAATVELRDTSNNLLASTTTAADGNYTFTTVPVGTYSVQVVNGSVRSTRPGSNGSERGVITYRTDGAGNTVNVAGTTFSQTITLSTTNLSNVNFGFNFDTVTNTNDSGAGSLRQFLINANLLGGDATLAQVGRTAGKENAILELSSSDPNYTTGYWSIPLQSALPSITAPIVLDASLPPGSNSNPILELKGTNAGSGANGLTLGAGSNASTIRKLAITGFAGSGIYIDSSDNNSLLANHIGITPSGITRANTGSGIRINAASSNNIGGINDGEGNLITNNGGSGISITNLGSMFNNILGNSIYANAGLGIDLVGGTENSFGVTANDAGDTDSGPNSLINYPEVKVNSFGANGTKIVTHDFNLDLAAGDYRLEFFVSTAKDASGNGEGQTFIGSKDLSHPGTGNLNFKGTLNAKIAVAKGAYISATLTQKTGPTTYGSTSEFSGIRDGITTQVCDSLIDDTTSGSNMVIDETDLTTVIKLLEAKDANGNPITYVISGGADGKFFTITNPVPGATLDCATIKFLVSNIIITKSALADNEAETRAIVTPGVLPLPGNHELPMDKDKDNVYDLQITATTVDGKKYVRDMNVRVMDTNEAPNITSATALTLTEDSSAEVLSVKAQDPDANEKLSYRISAGVDSSHFEINVTTGLLRFRAIPDYDAPMDTNRDNLYEVEVTVTDKGGLTNSKLFKISIVNNTADDGVVVNVRVLLQGAYDSNTALMSAELNTLGLLPNKQPYQYAPFNHAGTETLSTMLKETTGNNAVVDWALVDLRTSVNTIVASRAVILQRDGDLVDSQTGSANLHFANIKAGNYYISVRHRNHLGVMSASPVSLDSNAKLINFAASSTAVKGEEARALNGKVALMWAGDINGSNTLTANGPGNDVTSLLSGVITSTDNLQGNTNHILSGYLATDLNFDGKTLFTGPGNDTSLLVGNILLHPLNTGFAANYIVRGGLQ